MTHRFNLRVYYEDTDMAGIVYHANYLKFIERARSDWVREMGMDQTAMREQDGIVWVVRRIVSDFLKAAKYDDQLEVRTDVVSAKGVRLVMAQEIWRDQDLIFRAEVTAVCATTQGKPVRLPEALRGL